MSESNPPDHELYAHDGAGAAGGGAEKMDVASDMPSDQEHLGEAVDAAMPLMSVTSNQLTLLFQGEVYVFDSVSPEKVQAVLLLLGGCEVPTGIAGMTLPCHQDDKGLDDLLRRTNIPAKRIASLIRFREKRKERCFDKKIRYNVRKEVALRMQRRKGQFAGKANPQEGASVPSTCELAQSSGQDDSLQESKCQNCGISEKMTPAMRRGPAGPRSLCNACGLMWANKGTLRNLSKVSKMGTPSPANNTNMLGESIDSDTGDNKPLILASENQDPVVNPSEIAANGMPGDMQHEGGNELKTKL
ncbi:GATA transcription factor 18-like isoform X1 [Dioscorea cayenensis subsp. rotundata]|uniref:GATA transcription factor 18-like isoform X1 n=1 Tax=Dioscorea cayennensis subsp. rotundata TaxID=55577 RepID=A0AB40CKX1_DIOCR|nr:GATA transcription factor 18-like isoform X1 [Dioscorea cayenensis subsp. rotundata]